MAVDSVDSGAVGVSGDSVVVDGGHVLAADCAHSTKLNFVFAWLFNVCDGCPRTGDDHTRGDEPSRQCAFGIALKGRGKCSLYQLAVLVVFGAFKDFGLVFIVERGSVACDILRLFQAEFGDGDGIVETIGGD